MQRLAETTKPTSIRELHGEQSSVAVAEWEPGTAIRLVPPAPGAQLFVYYIRFFFTTDDISIAASSLTGTDFVVYEGEDLDTPLFTFVI